jgi:phenylacetic acid degradation operon negative regulatory protein
VVRAYGALAVVDGPDDDNRVLLPRTQVGSQPQHLLLTLIGDYFCDSDAYIPSAALVSLLEEFGVTSVGSRAALSRLSRRGLLSSAKSGRNTSYRLTTTAAAVLREGTAHVLAFGATDRPWSGTWTIVTFSVPEDQRRSRPVLRSRLRWLGFAPLYDGVWISPHPPTDRLEAVLERLGITASTVVVGTIRERDGASTPLSAWDLDDLRGVYTDFIGEFSDVRGRAARGTVGAAEGLVARTAIMDRWRTMSDLDPDLPAQLLPEDWPRKHARSLFVDVYDGLGELAEMRVRQILSGYSPALTGIVARRHTKDVVTH